MMFPPTAAIEGRVHAGDAGTAVASSPDYSSRSALGDMSLSESPSGSDDATRDSTIAAAVAVVMPFLAAVARQVMVVPTAWIDDS